MSNFVDYQDLHRKSPDKVKIPSKSALLTIKKNDSVKISTGGERFWVIVTDVNVDDITGEVNNDLSKTDVHGLSLGDQVEFKTCNVCDIIKF